MKALHLLIPMDSVSGIPKAMLAMECIWFPWKAEQTYYTQIDGDHSFVKHK